MDEKVAKKKVKRSRMLRVNRMLIPKVTKTKIIGLPIVTGQLGLFSYFSHSKDDKLSDFKESTEKELEDEEETFKAENFRLVRSKPDGNCLFRSVASGLSSSANGFSADQHMKVRQKAVEWMRNNMETEIDGLAFKHTIFLDRGQSVESYLKSMSKEGEWGDWSCILALAQSLNINFKVVFAQQNGKTESVINVKPTSMSKDTQKMWLLYHDRFKHYDLLVPKDDQQFMQSKL